MKLHDLLTNETPTILSRNGMKLRKINLSHKNTIPDILLVRKLEISICSGRIQPLNSLILLKM